MMTYRYLFIFTNLFGETEKVVGLVGARGVEDAKEKLCKFYGAAQFEGTIQEIGYGGIIEEDSIRRNFPEKEKVYDLHLYN